MKTYRIAVDMIENGYIEVQAKNKKEALQQIDDNLDSFTGFNSHASIGEVLEVR